MLRTNIMSSLYRSPNLVSVGGYIALGASPPVSGAIRIDAASYGSVGYHQKNATSVFTIETTTTYTGIGAVSSGHTLYIFGGGQNKWGVFGASGTSILSSSQATAQIIGGATNGLAIRNSANTRDNFRVYDDGTEFDLTSASYQAWMALSGVSGERTAGVRVQGASGTDVWISPASPAGNKAGAVYYNQTQWYSAWEVACTSSGFGALDLMKSGGTVRIGANANGIITFLPDQSAAGERLAGPIIASNAATNGNLGLSAREGTGSGRLYAYYYNSTDASYLEAWGISNLTGAGVKGTLSLMKSGGGVTIGNLTYSAYGSAGGAALHLPNVGAVLWRNQANTQNIGLRLTTGDVLSTNAGTVYPSGVELFAGSGFGLTIGSTGQATFTASVIAGSGYALAVNSRLQLASNSDGVAIIMNWAGTDFGRLQFGGTTSSFPSLKRTSAQLDVRLADDSAYGNFRASTLITNSGSLIDDISDGIVRFRNNTGTAFTAIAYGPAASATSVYKLQKKISAMADNTFVDTFTVTIPNAAHSAMVRVVLVGSSGAGGAIGANEATNTVAYDLAITRVAGVATVTGLSAQYGSSSVLVAGANAVTTTANLTAMTGAVGATQTFTIQTKVARAAGTATNHTCTATAELINANATGITIA